MELILKSFNSYYRKLLSSDMYFQWTLSLYHGLSHQKPDTLVSLYDCWLLPPTCMMVKCCLHLSSYLSRSWQTDVQSHQNHLFPSLNKPISSAVSSHKPNAPDLSIPGGFPEFTIAYQCFSCTKSLKLDTALYMGSKKCPRKKRVIPQVYWLCLCWCRPGCWGYSLPLGDILSLGLPSKTDL